MQKMIAALLRMALGGIRIPANKERGYLKRITQHFDGIYPRRPLGKSIITYDQIGPLADFGKLNHRFAV